MIAWVDVETSGLDESAGHLLEVALVVTDDALNEVASTSALVCPWLPIEVVEERLDDVVRTMHTKNGLLDDLKKPGVLTRYEVEVLLCEWVREQFKSVPDVAIDKCENCGNKESEHSLFDGVWWCLPLNNKQFTPKTVSALSQTPLAGSTVGFDRRWLRAHLPAFEKMFSYRSIDVSSLTELAKRWVPEVYERRPRAAEAHRALADVRESIAYLRYFREQGFVDGERRGPCYTTWTFMGNSERVAVEADWRQESGVTRCWAFGGPIGHEHACGIPVKHTGTPHRFCMRAPHDGYCDGRCFAEKCT